MRDSKYITLATRAAGLRESVEAALLAPDVTRESIDAMWKRVALVHEAMGDHCYSKSRYVRAVEDWFGALSLYLLIGDYECFSDVFKRTHEVFTTGRIPSHRPQLRVQLDSYASVYRNVRGMSSKYAHAKTTTSDLLELITR